MSVYKNNSSYTMKKNNEKKVLNLIYRENPIYRAQIAEKTNLTQQSVTNIVRRLIDKNLVIECLGESTSVGRNPINLQINSSNLYAVGIEISTKWIHGVVIDFNKEKISEQKIKINKDNNKEDMLNVLINLIDLLIEPIDDRQKIRGIGISIEGVIDKANGVVVKANEFNWENFKLRDVLEERYVIPVWLENDVNMIAVVENAEGILINSDDNITIKFDQGIGAAIVFNKKLYTGVTHIAGEFGHYKSLYGEGAKLCRCGGRGCLTTIASIGSLEDNFKIQFDEIIHRLNCGEKVIIETMTDIGEVIGSALANIITFFNPGEILLTGRLIDEAGSLIQPTIEQKVNENIPYFCKGVKIHHKVLNDIALMGAKLVMEEMFKIPEEDNI